MKHIKYLVVIILALPLAGAGNLTAEKMAKGQALRQYMKGLNHYNKRHYGKAASVWRILLELEPDFEKAKIYMEKAAEKYEKMQRHFYLGKARYLEQKYKKAIEMLLITLRINPGHKKARRYLALCYAALGKAKESDKIIQRIEFEKRTYTLPVPEVSSKTHRYNVYNPDYTVELDIRKSRNTKAEVAGFSIYVYESLKADVEKFIDQMVGLNVPFLNFSEILENGTLVPEGELELNLEDGLYYIFVMAHSLDHEKSYPAVLKIKVGIPPVTIKRNRPNPVEKMKLQAGKENVLDFRKVLQYSPPVLAKKIKTRSRKIIQLGPIVLTKVIDPKIKIRQIKDLELGGESRPSFPFPLLVFIMVILLLILSTLYLYYRNDARENWA